MQIEVDFIYGTMLSHLILTMTPNMRNFRLLDEETEDRRGPERYLKSHSHRESKTMSSVFLIFLFYFCYGKI